MSDVRIVPYDPGRHAAFLFSNLKHCMRENWPWSMVPFDRIEGDVRNMLVKERVFAAESSGEVMGVSVCVPPGRFMRGEIVWCYVGYSYRKNGLGTKLCALAGPAPEVRYYTRATVRIAAEHGRELHWAGR